MSHSYQRIATKSKHDARYLPAPNFPTITEQLDFDYTKTEPQQLRPFKPKYHLTMGKISQLFHPLGTDFTKLTPQPSRI
jgi:hypothetical protein